MSIFAMDGSHLSFLRTAKLVKLFHRYFSKLHELTKEELDTRWASYKIRAFLEHGQVINRTFDSQQEFVKRYTEKTLSLLKFRLQRVPKFGMEHLSETEREYYFEICGVCNDEQLLLKVFSFKS